MLSLRRLTEAPGAYRDPDVHKARRPWALIVFAAACAFYLGMRLVQMAWWALDAIL